MTANRLRQVLALLAFACACGCSEASKEPREAKAAGGPMVATADQLRKWSVEPAGMRPVQIVEEATGKVAFNDESSTPVFSPYTGRVVELLARPGDAVAQGQPLFVIDTPDLVDAENTFLSGRAAVAKAQNILQQATRIRDRVQRLVTGEAAAPKDLEQAASDVSSAQSDLRAAEAQVDTARQRLLAFGKTAEEIDRLASSRVPDRTTKVFSPIAGTVIARKLGPGQYVRPDNPDPLFTVANVSTMWLLAQIYESQIPFIKLGEPVKVSVLAFPGQVFPASVSYISPAVDPATRRIPVRCVILNRGGQLKPEMFASFRFEESSSSVLMVPDKAVVQEGGLKIVWVLEAGNRLSRRIVETGREQGGYTQIVSGVRAGEQVIADGALFLTTAGRG